MKKRRSVRWMGWFLVIVVVLPLAALFGLYTPLVQRHVTRWVTAWLTERTGMQVSIKSIGLSYPLRITARGVSAGEWLRIGSIGTNVRIHSLRQGVIEASYVSVRDLELHTDTITSAPIDLTAQHFLIEGITYRWEGRKARAHSMLISEGYLKMQQHAELKVQDTSSIKLPIAVEIDEMRLLRTRAHYSSTGMELTARTADIELHHIAADTLLGISLGSIAIEGGAVTLARQGTERWEATELAARADGVGFTSQGYVGRLSHLRFRESHGFHLQEGTALITWHEGAISIPEFSLRTTHSLLSGQLRRIDYSTPSARLDCEVSLQIGYADALHLSRWTKRIPQELIAIYPTETLSASIAVEGTTERLIVKQCILSLPTALDIGMQGELCHLAHPEQSEVRARWELTTRDLDFLQGLIPTKQVTIPHDMTCQGILLYTPDTMSTQCILALQEGRAIVEANYDTMDERYTLKIEADSLNARQVLPEGEIGVVSGVASLAWEDNLRVPSGGRGNSDINLHTLQWRELTFSNATAQITLADSTLRVQAACHDSLMQWSLTTTARKTSETLRAELHARINDLDLQALQFTDTSLHPSLECHATLDIDPDGTYCLHSEFDNITLSTPGETIRPRPILLDALWADDTARLTLTAGGIASPSLNIGNIALTARYAAGRLSAQLQTAELSLQSPLAELRGRASGTLAWAAPFTPDSLQGMLQLTAVHCSLPAYNLQLHTADTLSIPLVQGMLTLQSLPLYAYGKRPLLLDGAVALWGTQPTLQLRLSAHDVDLLSPHATHETLLYGKALLSGDVTLSGELASLAINGSLQLRPGTSIHYIYRDAILTAGNQLESVITFVNFEADSTATLSPPRRLSTKSISIGLDLTIDPTAEVEVSLGRGAQNYAKLQGGGTLHLQYAPTSGVLLAGHYAIEAGDMTMNIPLLHVSHMSIRPGSTVTWTGNPLNPQLNLSAEEHLRASVTLDGEPQSVLFVAGLSITETMEQPQLQLTLTAPESASMQNMLATLSAEERGKLAVALLTTGLYLGEGGTGSLMNTALMSLLQSQLDDLSRDALRTVDVSIGIDPLFDGVSGVSTRTDYTFSLAKRLWNNRLRIIIGGSVTSSGQHIESDGVIDNISIEWRVAPAGHQYLRLFHDKHYESILEGEIRETGVGYAYRRRFYKLKIEN